MSLKAFHLFFILVSMLLSVFVAVWGFRQSNAIAYPSIIGAIALIAYLVWFLKKGKSKPTSVVAAILFSNLVSPSAQACAVCFGLADKQTTDALGNSIWFMIGVTAVVLSGLTWIVLRIIRAANQKIV
jgi:hypothetical protein